MSPASKRQTHRKVGTQSHGPTAVRSGSPLVARLPKGPSSARSTPRCGVPRAERVYRHTEKRERPMLFFKRTRRTRPSSHPPKAILRVEQLESRLVLSSNSTGHALYGILTAASHSQSSACVYHASVVIGEGGFGSGWAGGGQHGAGRGYGMPHHPSGKVSVGNSTGTNSSACGNQLATGIGVESGFGTGWGGHG
jgi:hypothetical protein